MKAYCNQCGKEIELCEEYGRNGRGAYIIPCEDCVNKVIDEAVQEEREQAKEEIRYVAEKVEEVQDFLDDLIYKDKAKS